MNMDLARMARLHSDLLEKITVTVPSSIAEKSSKNWLTKHNSVMESLCDALREPDPDGSLKTSAERPFRVFQSPFMNKILKPIDKWAQFERQSIFWPEEVRDAAKILGLGKARLPDWKKITKCAGHLGFEAYPVRGYVGLGLYTYLFNTKRIPVCVQWAARARRSLYFVYPTDAAHDIAHLIALGKNDYLKLSSAFFKRLGTAGKYINTKDCADRYSHYFEHAAAFRSGSDSLEPIGATALAFETLRVRNGKLEALQKDGMMLPRPTHRIFKSREHWREEASSYVRGIGCQAN